MAPFLDHGDVVDELQQDDVHSLKLMLEGFASRALEITPRKIRNQSHKTWLELGGDSLTAVNFMGFCHEAGIDVDIPDVFLSDSLDELLDRIAQSHQSRKSASNEDDVENGDHGNSRHYGLPEEGPLLGILRGHGPLDGVQGIGPCSPMQENFIALQRIDPRAYQLRLAARMAFTNPAVVVTTDMVEKSWSAVVRRHAALRTMFVESVDRPGRFDQVVWRNINPQVSVLPLSEAEDSKEEHGSEFPHHLILAQAPDNKVFVKLSISHAVMDGVSVEILFRDLFRALAGSLPADEEPLQFGNFLHAQQPDASQEALAYWSRYMAATEGTFLSSPSSKKSPTGPYSIDQEIRIRPELAQSLSGQFNATLVNACQVAYALVLRCYTGANNVCFSYTTSGRQKRVRGLHDAVGAFVNTLPCRVDFGETTTIAEALGRAQSDFLESLPYQGASLTDKQEMSGASVRQLGDSLLSFYGGLHETELAKAGFAVEMVSWEAPSDYNYTLMIGINQHKLELRLNLWESLTCREDGLNMMQLFRDSLDFVLQNTSKPCADFVGLTMQDQSKILASNGSAPAIVHNCVHEQVWAVAQRQPNAPAICAWDGELTYSELEAPARRLAAYLVRLGVGLEVKVGLCMDKSRWVPVAMLAVLQAGGAVVPLGNQHPPNRIQTIARNAGIALLVADRVHAKRLEGIVSGTVEVDAILLDKLPPPPEAAAPAWPSVTPDNAGWVVYTSGSTGVPKGVVLQHKALCTPMHAQAARYGMGPWTRALQFSAHTFDITVKDFFTTLSFGGCVCIPSETQRVDDLGMVIRTFGVTFATLTPTVTSLLDPRDLPTLNTIVATGEALKPAVVQPWLEEGRVRWFNAYGPSECSHTSTINGPITRAEDAPNIGFPALNCLWVTDPLDFNRLSPIGAVGELLIEGPIAREYLHDPAKTAASFVVDPGFVSRLGLTPGRRMYRTGDLVRQNKDGSLTYLGRRDTQIKIRGQRVEVREIESRISQSLPGNPPVCVDLVQPQGSDLASSMLFAAIDMRHEAASQAGTAPGTLCEPSESLRDRLQNLHSKLVDELPLYMVPGHLVPFAVLPTNASGKQDRQATRAILERLTERELAMFKQTDVAKGTISTETEKGLQAVWAEVLGRPAATIGSNDHFMQLGGDSVVAMRTVAIARRNNISLSVADIVQHSRLADLARIVDGHGHMAEKAAKEDPVPFELWDGFISASAEEQERRLASVASQCNIPPSHVMDVYPTSPLQEGLMAMTSREPGTYVAQQVFRIDPKVDVEHFQKAWAKVASSLATLRTRIVYTPDAGSAQVVTRDAPRWTTATSDLSAFLAQDRTASFGYGTPLHRFAIIHDSCTKISQGQSERYFAWTAHHSAYDGETISRTLRMVAQVYQGGPCDTVTPIPRFVRYLARQIGQSEGGERAKAYWKKELENAQLARFPESPSPAYRPFADGVLRHRFAQPGGQGSGRVSLAILLRAAWALVVASRTGSTEAMLAVVLSGRDTPVFGIEGVVAPTITTVPARIQVDRRKAVVDFLSSIDAQNKEMAPYSQFGLANIRREVPDLGHDFDPGHLFAVHIGGTPPEDITAAQVLGLERTTGERQNFEGYALVVECMLDTSDSGSDSIEIEVHFDKNVVSPARAAALISQLEHVTRELEPYNLPDAALTAAQRDTAIGNLDLIAPGDKEKLLSWNRPPPDPVQVTLDELFQGQSRKNPQAQAICTRERNLTYSQLDAAAGRLAQHLISLGIGPEMLVGLCMDKSEFAIVSMLAISRAGGAVVPLGIQFSDSRIKGLIADAEISVALVDSAQAKRFSSLVPRPIVVNASLLGSLPPAQHTPAPVPRARPSNPAWVIFTSGSTGVPKGVVLEHQALCSGVLANGVRYGVTSSTRTFQFSAFTFDVSITDIWTTLAYGGCICIPSEQGRTDGVAAAMNELAVTFAVLTPTVTSLLDPDSVPASLDTIVFVGEAIKPAAVEPWLGRVKNLFNGYGPAECSIYSVINGPILRAEDAPIIGSNLSNRLWVTNPLDHNSLVPIGAPGELLIEGPALARSYLHDPAKTAKSFVVDPRFITSLHLPPGRRMYRTGDLVRQNPEDGLLVCLGRIDTQIKIRGQRVEVGEIESHIMRLKPEIQHACVDLVRLRNVPDPMLLAAVELQVTRRPGEADDSDAEHDDPHAVGFADAISRPSPRLNAVLGELRSDLVQILPLYMVPTHIVPMKLPVNASGKLDRRAARTILEGLSREQLRAFADDARKSTMVDRMLSETEEQLRLLWAQVLGLPADEIRGADDDFFELGGDSVSAMRLVAAAQAAPVPMRLGVLQILQNPRLMDMARVASEHPATAARAEAADPEPFELWNGFTDADADTRKERLAALAEQCQDVAGPGEIVDVYPSTPLQEGLMAITSKQTSAYVAQQVFRLGPDVDVSRLQRAWELLGSKLAILRTRIVYTAQGSVQVVVRKAPQWAFASDLRSYLAQDQSQPFAYGTPLHRQAIVQDGETNNRYFVWTVHHAAYDGWSLLLVLRMLVRTYQGEEGSESFVETPIPRFIRYLQQADEDAMAAYWRNQLGDAQLTRFPQLPSSTYQPHAGSLVQTRLRGFSEKYRSDTAGGSGSGTTVSLGVLLQAAWAVTVATYTGSNEALVNVALSGRDTPVQDIANVVGPTLATVPIRIKVDKEQCVGEFLAAVARQAKEMVPFAHAGLHRIRNAVPGLGSDFDAGHLFIIQPALTDSDSPGLEAIGLEQDNAAVAESAESRDFGGYALAVDCTVNADSVDIEIRYDSDVLPQPRATALLSQFEHTIRQLESHAAGRKRPTMADLDIFSPADADIVRRWNQNTPPAKQACIHELIQLMVDKHPAAPAVDAWDGEFSYAALGTTARRLAHHLVSHCGVGPEVTVGLCMDKSRWAVVSIVSILMAGGVVVPLGVQQPLARIETIARDSEMSTILVDTAQARRLARLGGATSPPRLVVVDAALLGTLPPPPAATATRPVCDSVSPDNAAWIVYTSGSTGVPKGVVLEHKALCSSFRAHGPRVGFGPDTRALQFSAYTFDNCIEDILSVLTVGGCVCVPSEDQRLNALADTIRRMNVNLLNATPTVASLIQPTDVPMLKTLLLGGETVYPAVVEQWLGHAKIINTYGPAECCVDVACSAPMKQPSDAYTIGFPLDVCFWVASASDYNRLVPVGAPGELLIEGPHLGRGYLNDADKTAKAFVWDPDFVALLGLAPGRRMYRTGDLVRQNADGSLIHLGRIDAQIKIRGQRVETGEIESNIVRLQREVRVACVDLVRLSDHAASGGPMLVVAIEVGEFGRDENDKDSEEAGRLLAPQTVRRPTDALGAMIRNLRAGLLLVLPRYMVPHFVPMTSLPLNPSGKLDRRATRAILARLSREQLGAFEKPPAEGAEDGRALSPLEDQLGRLWSEVLGCSPREIGAHAHFVQLGGDSVTAMRLVAAAQGAGIRIGVADILQNPRLSDLARAAENYSATRGAEQDPAPFELWKGFADADAEEQKRWLSGIAERCDVAPQDIEDIYPATPLQEGLMAVTAQQPGAYVAQHVFRIRQDVDMARFKESWSTLMNALAILRTRIVYHTARSGSVQVVVRRALDWNEADDLQAYLAKDKALPFAYGTPLNRLAIVDPAAKTDEGEETDTEAKYFVWTQHHSGYDGYQIALMLNMLAQIYRDGGEQHLPPPPPVPRFIRYLQQTDKEQAATYWKQQLQDAHLTRFPLLRHPSYHPHADGLLQQRVGLGQGSGGGRPHDGAAPIAILLRAAWAITVAAYTGSTEATSTVALAGRDIAVLDIGNAVVPTLATVPMRTRLDDRTQLVSDLLAAMGRQADEMRPFLHTGMQHIRAAVPGLGIDFDPGHLFLVQPSMGDKDRDPLEAIGLEEVHATDKADFGGYALAAQCTVNPDRTVDVELRYDSGVLPTPMACALLSQFAHVIQQLETHGDAAIGDLDLLKPADVERIRRWNQPVLQAAPNRACIHDLVQTMVDRQPHAQAVASWDGELSYAALSRAASRLAHHLVSLGVGPEVTVGVCMDKSLWAMVSMLAILQAGGVVVALGTQHPLSRIATIVADAGIRVALVDQAQAERLQGQGVVPQGRIVVVDRSFVEQLPAHHTTPPCTGVKPDNAAWIVYTSGSTGTPKGVVLQHQALCTGIIAHGTLFGNNAHTRALQFASHTFGVVMEDMFTTLIFGGCTCIPSEDQRMNMSELAGAMRQMHVNFVNLTATAASLIDPHDVPEVETVVLGGEAVTPAVVELWAGHAKILNAYGQSECAVESVVNSRVEHGRDAANIGLPIAGSAAWVVDPSDYNRLVPVGAPGELLIQGPLLARGYLNDADKTAACFVSDPGFLAQLGFHPTERGNTCTGRMYRTGDLVQQNEDGSLVYLGRRDAQIKVRGQRVEPGEIESRIVQLHPAISHAFVDLARPRDAPAAADPVLVAAVELQEPRQEHGVDYDDKHGLPSAVRPPTQHLTATMQEIRAALLQELPAYMVPRYFIPVASRLPVNASGKLDRRAARAILESLSRDQLGAFNTRAARDPDRVLSATEEQLRAAYAEVLGCPADNIGPDDAFTELGGDSVAAMHVVGACRRRGIVISVRDVLQRQSISALSACAKTRTTRDGDDDDVNGVPDESSSSDAVTDIQEWMLNYHVARPDVGMTWFALDAAGPLVDGGRMADACRKLFTTIEVLHTGFVHEDGRWRRVVLPAFQPDVQTYTADAGAIGEWTEDFIRREGSKPLEPGRPLADIAICTTTAEHRVLVRLSHAIYDGMCIHRFWSTLDDLYRHGRARNKVASFSQYVAHVEKRRTPEASRYWADLLRGAAMTPIGRRRQAADDTDNYVWRAGVMGPKRMDLGRRLRLLPRGATCAHVVKAAWALVLARHAGRDDVVFADLVSGRAGIDDDPSVADALGCCSTPLPVRVRLDPSSTTYADLVAAVRAQQLDGIPFETFGLGRITRDCTDWPAGTAATSWINHVPARIGGSRLDIGGTEYTLSQPRQEEQRWTFSEARISWLHGADDDDDDVLEFHLVYAVDTVPEQAARRLYDGVADAIEQILTSPHALIGSLLFREL